MSDTTDDRLELLISRIERLTEERKAIQSDIADVYTEAASAGYDKKVLRQVVKLRAMRPDERQEMQAVLDAYGLEKKSRIGYSIGVGYAPDWGEHTISFRPGDETPLPENAVVHIILGMWMEGWGMELSETIHVREHDAICLTRFPRDVHIIDT